MFDDIFIYVFATNEIIKICEGTGDNLSREDVEEGYVDYIYYETYAVEDGFPEDGGGQVMLKELFQEKYSKTEDCIDDVLDMEYGNRNLDYVVLKERKSIV